ncbi:MAG: DUF4405 domain-containing protein [Lawsonibacter sp.]|nr:DUF4405 domain-containing protein [Lawsonibacter sp.]
MAEKNRRVNAGQVLRRLTDLAMALLLLFLMAYFITEQEIHEWLGVGMLVLFLLHHGLNWKWFQALVRGRYTPRRILQTVLLLFVSMAAQIVSGLAMARHVLPFLEVPISIAAARRIHLACGYWSFLLTGLHLGLHWGIFLGLGRKLLAPAVRWALRIAAVAVAVWGGVCFVRQNIADYMFLRVDFVFFDYEKSPLLVMWELAAMFALWTLAGYLLQRLTWKRVRETHG